MHCLCKQLNKHSQVVYSSLLCNNIIIYYANNTCDS